MELCTPCAGLRPGAADPKRSKAAYPPPRWVFGYLLIDCGQKILIFGAPGTGNLDFWCSGDKNLDFWCSRERKY